MNAREFFKTRTGTTPIADEKFTTEYMLKFAEDYLKWADAYRKASTEKAKPKKTEYKKRYMNLSDKFFFGKYKGELLSDILDVDEDYIKWCLENFDGFYVTPEASFAIADEIGNKYVVPKERIGKFTDADLPF